MQPNLSLLTPDLIARILDEAFQLMMKPGIKVQSAEAIRYLQNPGAAVDESAEVVHIPENLVRQALDTVPSVIQLYDLHGKPKVQYGGNAVHLDPGSSGVHILDPDTPGTQAFRNSRSDPPGQSSGDVPATGCAIHRHYLQRPSQVHWRHVGCTWC